jgi:dihydrofolate reductase
MKLALIVAIDQDRGIGKNNDLLWHLPRDMRFFKETTMGHVVVMGRKNYESIPERFRPLPGRENVVLTRNGVYDAPECAVFNSLEACLEYFKNEKERTIFIIGGGQIYKEAISLDLIDTMYITEVAARFEADTFFPLLDENTYTKTKVLEYEADEKNQHSFVIWKFERM